MDAATRMSDAACVARDPAARVRDRDDACPGTVDAAVGDDGLIARIRLPGGRVTGRQLRVLAACAQELGKGFVDLTVRANAQVRGLSEAGIRELGARLADAGLFPSPTHDRVRNIAASPFAGRDPDALVDADRLTAALDAALCAVPELAALPGRFQFAVDDGGLRVATRRHDVALAAVAGGVVELRLAGMATGRYADTPDAAVALAVAAARAFLRARESNGAWHVRELPGGGEGLARLLGDFAPTLPDVGTAAGNRLHDSRSSERTGPVVGVVPQADGRMAVSALVPLGRLSYTQLVTLADLLESSEVDVAGGVGVPSTRETGSGMRLRIAAWRGVVVGDIPRAAADVVAVLDAAGLPCDPDSGWLGVSACSGVGECRRASVDVRSLAREFATEQCGLGAVHFVACERACGRPARAALVVADKTADDAPQRFTVTAERPEIAEGVRTAVAELRLSGSIPPADCATGDSTRSGSNSPERHPWTTG